jgi:membrane fusion protein, multidrug efflux system
MSSPHSTTNQPTSAQTPKPEFKKRKAILGLILSAAILVAGFFGISHLIFTLSHEQTDDAQVENDISPVLPRIPGYITNILIKDNQVVEAGQTLVEIDNREPTLKVEAATEAVGAAKAALATANANLMNAKASAAVAKANILAASINEQKTATDYARDQNLAATHAITERQLSDSKAAAELAKANLEAIRRQSESAYTQVTVATSQVHQAQAVIRQRESDLHYAQLELTYTKITAPISGIISHKAIEPGQFIQAGQTLMSIASNNNAWVIANFKETQVAKMQAGQSAEFTVDGYSGKVFHGKVDSMSPATGARFALLPPDNASGNFVKVTQRVPVKIIVTDPADPDHPLRAGMSVDAAVQIKQ